MMASIIGRKGPGIMFTLGLFIPPKVCKTLFLQRGSKLAVLVTTVARGKTSQKKKTYILIEPGCMKLSHSVLFPNILARV